MKAKRSKKGESTSVKRILTAFLFVLILSIIILSYDFYKKIFAPNVSLKEKKTAFLYIPTNADFNGVIKILVDNNFINNTASFSWVAERLNYKQNILPGKYLIEADMNNKELVTLLRSGKQTPVKLVLNNIRTKPQLASKVSKCIEADSLSIIHLLNDESYLARFNHASDDALSFFIPNTYEFYWNTSAEQFMERMSKEYNRFWTEERKAKAQKLELLPVQIAILASIVEQETTKNSEKNKIAGVYINRLKKGWKLEADPTLVYALGDFTVRRVLNIYKKMESPYNTYKYSGLPPGPICIPSISSLDAVLNYQEHDYLFFCAKEDFSGYHNFAKTYQQHRINARKFQKELNRRNIRS